jgi:large repetitive protein
MIKKKGLVIICLALLLFAGLTALFYTELVHASQAAGRTYTTNDDFEEGTMVGVEAVDDQLQLTEKVTTLPFIWVPNNSGTVSKVDTETGNELGRYRVVPPGLPENGSPSRTTVDLQGNVWVGNRTAGTVVKIGLYEAGQLIDRNGDGIIQTSRDLNEDGDITGDEILPWGEDECVLFEVVLVPGHEGTNAPGEYDGPYDTDIWALRREALLLMLTTTCGLELVPHKSSTTLMVRQEKY